MSDGSGAYNTSSGWLAASLMSLPPHLRAAVIVLAALGTTAIFGYLGNKALEVHQISLDALTASTVSNAEATHSLVAALLLHDERARAMDIRMGQELRRQVALQLESCLIGARDNADAAGRCIAASLLQEQPQTTQEEDSRMRSFFRERVRKAEEEVAKQKQRREDLK